MAFERLSDICPFIFSCKPEYGLWRQIEKKNKKKTGFPLLLSTFLVFTHTEWDKNRIKTVRNKARSGDKDEYVEPKQRFYQHLCRWLFGDCSSNQNWVMKSTCVWMLVTERRPKICHSASENTFHSTQRGTVGGREDVFKEQTIRELFEGSLLGDAAAEYSP